MKLTANPQESNKYKFDHGTGICSGKKTTCTVTMSKNQSAGAVFKK